MNIKTSIEFGFRIMKNHEDLGGYYPPQPTASKDALQDLHNSS